MDLRLGRTPPHPHRRESIVVIPASTVSLLTERAVSAGLSRVETRRRGCGRRRRRRAPAHQRGVGRVGRRDPDPGDHRQHRSLRAQVLRYVKSIENDDATIIGLIPQSSRASAGTRSSTTSADVSSTVPNGPLLGRRGHAAVPDSTDQTRGIPRRSS